MLTNADIIWGMVVPALAAGVGVGLQWLWRREGPAWGVPLVLGASFALAYGPIAGAYPAFPPRLAEDGLYYAAMALAVIGVADALWSAPAWLRAIGVAGLSLLIGRLMLGFLFRHQWSGAAGWMWLGLFAGVVLAWWVVLERLADRERGWVTPLILSIIAAATSAVLMGSGTAKLGKFAIPLTVVPAILTLAALVLPRLWLGRGTMIVFTPLLLGLVVLGYYLADLTLAHALIIAAAPVYVGIGLLLPAQRMRRWQIVVVRVLLVALPLLTMAAMVTLDTLRELDSPEQDEDYYY